MKLEIKYNKYNWGNQKSQDLYECSTLAEDCEETIIMRIAIDMCETFKNSMRMMIMAMI